MIAHGSSLAQWQIGDCRETLRQWAAAGIRAQTCVTSPPYFGLRDYDRPGQLGLEATPQAFVDALVEVFRGVRDVLTDSGTLWLNMGDSYVGGGRGGNSVAITGAGKDKSKRDRREVSSYQRDAAPGKRDNAKGVADLKHKDLIGIPWRLAFALQADGWWLRQDIIWAKGTSGLERTGGGMPESVKDRCSKSHEYLFLLSKKPRYYFDYQAIQEPAQDWGKPRDRSQMRGGTTDPKLKHGGLTRVNHPMGNRRSVWRINTSRYVGAHFATFPPGLVEPCVLAGTRPGDTVLDPFGGSGTTAGVALKHGRNALMCELNADYSHLFADRIRKIVDAPVK